MKVSVWFAALALLGLTALTANPVAAQETPPDGPTPTEYAPVNPASVSIDYCLNIGALTPLTYIEVTSGGPWADYFNPATVSVAARTNPGGDTKSKSGKTYIRLKNATAAPITILGFAVVYISADADCVLKGTAEATITDGATATATASANGEGPNYGQNQAKPARFVVTDLLPGEFREREGTFTITSTVAPTPLPPPDPRITKASKAGPRNPIRTVILNRADNYRRYL